MIRLLFTLLFLVACQKNYPVSDMGKRFTRNYGFAISDSLGIQGSIVRLQQVNDSILVFNDFLRKAIFKTNIKTKRTTQLGSNGTGPGQYITPYRFVTDNENIWFTDLGDFSITHLSLDGKHVQSTKLKNTLSLFLNWNNKTLGVVGSRRSHFLFDGDKPLAFSMPIGLQQLPSMGIDALGLEEIDDVLYFMNGFEAVIYSYDLSKNTEQKIPISGSFKENRISWERYIDSPISKRAYWKMLEEHEGFTHYTLAKIDGELTHLLEGSDNDSDTNWLYLINSAGEILERIELGDYVFHRVYQSDFIFMRKDEDGFIHFSSFKLKERLVL